MAPGRPKRTSACPERTPRDHAVGAEQGTTATSAELPSHLQAAPYLREVDRVIDPSGCLLSMTASRTRYRSSEQPA